MKDLAALTNSLNQIQFA